MERKGVFHLEEHVTEWTEQIRAEPSFTDADAEELKTHLYDIIDSLTEKGLDDEEAFLVAKKRLGESYELAGEFNQANKPVIQMRRSLLILAGVLVYFMAFYFILSTSKLLVIALIKSSVGKYEAVEWVSRYLISWHFIVLLFFASLYFFEERTISFIERKKLKPRQALLYLGVTFFLATADTVLFPWAKRVIGDNLYIKDVLYHSYIYFEFSFPLLIGICFIIIYFKYYRKTKPVQ